MVILMVMLEITVMVRVNYTYTYTAYMGGNDTTTHLLTRTPMRMTIRDHARAQALHGGVNRARARIPGERYYENVLADAGQQGRWVRLRVGLGASGCQGAVDALVERTVM